MRYINLCCTYLPIYFLRIAILADSLLVCATQGQTNISVVDVSMQDVTEEARSAGLWAVITAQLTGDGRRRQQQ